VRRCWGFKPLSPCGRLLPSQLCPASRASSNAINSGPFHEIVPARDGVTACSPVRLMFGHPCGREVVTKPAERLVRPPRLIPVSLPYSAHTGLYYCVRRWFRTTLRFSDKPTLSSRSAIPRKLNFPRFSRGRPGPLYRYAPQQAREPLFSNPAVSISCTHNSTLSVVVNQNL